MVLLYTVLGTAMVTGIFAMFDVAFGIVNQQASLQPPPDPYVLSKTPEYGGYDVRRLDRELLSLLNGYDSSWDSDICAAIRSAASPASSPEFHGRLSGYVDNLPAPSLSGKTSGCSMTSTSISPATSLRHRVLLFPPDASGGSALLFTCLLQDGVTVCPIEQG